MGELEYYRVPSSHRTFPGQLRLHEEISAEKYPEYSGYQKKVRRFIPSGN